MDQLVAWLRTCSADRFRDFLWEYIRGASIAAVSTYLPPNDEIAVVFAEVLTDDEGLRARTQAAVPALFAHLSTESTDASIDRATALFGYTRAAAALPTAIALCDELDRENRTDSVRYCLSAIAAQLPTEPMLELLRRKGIRPQYSAVCARALLSFDRARAATLLIQLPSDALDDGFFRSALDALSIDELLDALKELYCAVPPASKVLLERVERACQATVLADSSSYELFVVRPASSTRPKESASLIVANVPRETRVVLQRAAERTAALSVVRALLTDTEIG